MAKFKFENFARGAVIGINVLFLILGLVTVVIGVVGFVKQNQLRQQSSVLSAFNLDTITIIVLVSGLGTCITSLFGLVGAALRIPNLLKLYCAVLLCIIGVQIGMGAWLDSLSISSLQNDWAEEDPAGQQRRVAFQNYFNCCGFNTWSDSMGQLYTPCPLASGAPANPPLTCAQAAQNFMNTYMFAIAAAAIAIACVELVALVGTCFLIFQGKSKEADQGFEY